MLIWPNTKYLLVFLNILVFTLWLFNSSPWKITIFNGKTIYKWTIFHGKLLNNQRVAPIECWLTWPSFWQPLATLATRNPSAPR